MTTLERIAVPAAPRLVLEATLAPIAGTRFQPTGFPNLGAAEFTTPDGKQHVLVESPQSIANRLEATAWDESANDLVEPLRGLPYVKTTVDGVPTDSIREAHRLNSPFLRAIIEPLRERAGIRVTGKAKKGGKAAPSADDGDATAAVEDSTSVDVRKLAAAVFAYDPDSVLHGVFLTNLVGLARLTRVVSGFIEAHDVRLVASGGVKNDRIDPSGNRYKSTAGKGGAAEGYGNVPFARSEYTAQAIVASFSLDLALVRSYGLPDVAQQLLYALGLWKIERFLETGLRLRTACDLEVSDGLHARRPAGAIVPNRDELDAALPELIAGCREAGLFVEPAVTEVAFGA